MEFSLFQVECLKFPFKTNVSDGCCLYPSFLIPYTSLLIPCILTTLEQSVSPLVFFIQSCGENHFNYGVSSHLGWLYSDGKVIVTSSSPTQSGALQILKHTHEACPYSGHVNVNTSCKSLKLFFDYFLCTEFSQESQAFLKCTLFMRRVDFHCSVCIFSEAADSEFPRTLFLFY